GLYFVYGSSPFLPTANARPPFDESTTLVPYPNAGLAPGASFVAASGARLLAYAWDSTSQRALFSLVNDPATKLAQAGTPQPVGRSVVARGASPAGADGSVLWTGGVPGALGNTSARLSWLLAGASSTSFDSSTYVDLETYPSQPSTNVAAPAGWLDADT